MADEELSQISVGEFEAVSQLLASSESLQLSFLIMIIGIIGIIFAYRKFSSWVGSQKFYYKRPHFSRFLRRAVLPFFAIALITSINVTHRLGVLPDETPSTEDEEALALEQFAKILNTFNILVIGYTIAHLIPIILTKREKSILEKEDFDVWFEYRGFSDDDDDLFHKLYKWIPPKNNPEDIDKDEFQELLSTEKECNTWSNSVRQKEIQLEDMKS